MKLNSRDSTCNLSISPVNMLAFLTALALADARRFQDPDDLVATLQVAQRWNQSALHPDGLEQRVLCGDYLLEDEHKTPIELRPRQSPAKLIDTFAFGNAYEVEELLLRMYEMGEEVSEFHIVEGDHDFQGAKKPYQFEAILNSGQFDACLGLSISLENCVSKHTLYIYISIIYIINNIYI